MHHSKSDDLKIRLEETAHFIRTKCGKPVHHAVVLGSGWGAFTKRLSPELSVPYSEIPGFSATTVIGHSGELVIGTTGKGVRVLVMKGRVHFYEGHPMDRVVFPIRTLKFLGIQNLILTNAAGGLGPSMKPGDFMIIRDHINLFGLNPLLGPNHDFLGTRFPDMSDAYNSELSQKLEASMLQHKARFSKGVYAYATGPSFETPAEIRAFKALGADAVGMSTVPETVAARHMGMNVAGVSCISNLAAGISPTKLSHEEVSETAKSVENIFCNVLETFFEMLGNA